MKALSQLAFQGVGFQADGTVDGDVLTVRLQGNADMKVAEPFAVVFQELHGAAVVLKIRDVVVDVRDLEFMNSTCFKYLVSWLGRVQALEPSSRYRTRFVSSPDRRWQHRSLHALRCFAVDIVTVD